MLTTLPLTRKGVQLTESELTYTVGGVKLGFPKLLYRNKCSNSKLTAGCSDKSIALVVTDDSIY